MLLPRTPLQEDGIPDSRKQRKSSLLYNSFKIKLSTLLESCFIYQLTYFKISFHWREGLNKSSLFCSLHAKFLEALMMTTKFHSDDAVLERFVLCLLIGRYFVSFCFFLKISKSAKEAIEEATNILRSSTSYLKMKLPQYLRRKRSSLQKREVPGIQ